MKFNCRKEQNKSRGRERERERVPCDSEEDEEVNGREIHLQCFGGSKSRQCNPKVDLVNDGTPEE